MEIGRLRQAKQCLQQPVDAGGREKIEAAHDMGYALQRVVRDDGKMVARRHVAARQHNVAP